MRIDITDLQRGCRIDRVAVRMLVRWLMKKAAAMNPQVNWVECSVVLVDHRRMAALNQSSLGHDGTTDVITFAYQTQPGEIEGRRGEVVVNVEMAMEEGRRRPGGRSRELALYIAHGCQHLGGADDASTEQRAAMNRRQNRWLREAAAEGLLDDLVK